jgi:hypothetical protein
MLVIMILSALFAVFVITFLVQYRSYNNSQKQLLSVVTPLTEDRGISNNKPSGLQLALNEEIVATGYPS